jgi:hypothetical protein
VAQTGNAILTILISQKLRNALQVPCRLIWKKIALQERILWQSELLNVTEAINILQIAFEQLQFAVVRILKSESDRVIF